MPRADNKFNRCACVPRVQLCVAVCVSACVRVCACRLQQTVALGRVAALLLLLLTSSPALLLLQAAIKRERQREGEKNTKRSLTN